MLQALVCAFAIHSGYFLRKVTRIVNMKAKTGVSDRGRVRNVSGGIDRRS
jgi:hypothetical protein